MIIIIYCVSFVFCFFVFFFGGGVRFGGSCIIISKLQYHDQHALMAVIMSCSEFFKLQTKESYVPETILKRIG